MNERDRASEGVGDLSVPALPSRAESPPESIRDYRLLEKLGQGGMGEVYLARHEKLGREVAIKLLPSDRTRHADALARFQREMKAVGKLHHPNIVAAHDAGEAAGRHFLVMEWVDGVDLARIVRQRGPLKVADACD